MIPLLQDDFVPTLSDDDDVPDESELQQEEAPRVSSAKRKREDKKQAGAVKKQKTWVDQTDDDEDAANGGDKDSDVASDFEFDTIDRTTALSDFDGWNLTGDAEGDVKPGRDDLEAILARRRPELRKEKKDGEDDGHSNRLAGEEGDLDSADEDEIAFEPDGSAHDEDSDEGHHADDDNVEDLGGIDAGVEDNEEEDDELAAPVTHPDDVNSDVGPEPEQDPVEAEKRRAFFATDDSSNEIVHNGADSTFAAMSLSRPILKGLSEVGFSRPTPIQSKTIPVALEGKDIVGGAVTGSGKTAAFLIPILERLLYRPKRVATMRVAILMPTRELAMQCLSVAKKLAAFTDITFGCAIGGLNSREQERELKLRPDIVIATPGRFIDFMRNSASFQTDKLEILVLDEADRMLEQGFSDEINEILGSIPKSRQTMLFSATMDSRVDDLIRAGLQRPVRLMVDAQKATTSGLVQEFIRLRPGRESKRLGYLLYVCSNIHTERVIIFFRQKKETHHIRVVFGLCGMKAAELHGSMSQEQRIQAIESFRSGRAPFLLATDLASRGLDIKGIETVINYEAPQTHEIYLHRVGRTARAGRKGVSCTLAAEPDRKVVKAAVRAAKIQGATIRQRTVDPKDADTWQARCDALEDDIEDVLREEKEEKALQVTERVINRAENVVKYEDEIKARPRKTWFQSEKEKDLAAKKGAVVLNGPEGGVKKARKGKLSNKQAKRLQDTDDRKAGVEWKKRKPAAKIPAKKAKKSSKKR